MIQIERFDTRAQALIAERNAIVTEKPKFNKIHTDLVKDNSAKKILNCKDVSGLTNISVQKLRATVRNGCCPVAPIPGMKPPKWRASDVDAFCARDAG